MRDDKKQQNRYQVEVHQGGETYVRRVVETTSSGRAAAQVRDQVLAGLPPFLMSGFDKTQPFEMEVTRRFKVVPEVVVSMSMKDAT